MKNIDKILDETEKIQKELHSMIDEIRKTERGKNIPYQDLVTGFFLMKLAELKEEIKEAGLILRN
jgi:predicted O-methyltransferase YrrM